MWKAKLIAGAVLAALAVIWILQNRGPVQTKFLFVTVAMPQPLLLAVIFLAGLATGILLALGLMGKRDTGPRDS